MRAQSYFQRAPRANQNITDRRGNTRTIKFYTGYNKGKVYPYRSKKRGGKTQ